MVRDHTDIAMAPVRIVTHPSSIQAHGCLNPVINHETLTPIYQVSFPLKHVKIATNQLADTLFSVGLGSAPIGDHIRLPIMQDYEFTCKLQGTYCMIA